MKGKKRKVISRNAETRSIGGRSFCSSVLDKARSRWRTGDPAFALNMIMEITSKYPRHEPAYRLMLSILIEEGYHPKDIIWCLGRLKKLGCLRPRDKLEYGIREFELSHFKKALPLLEKASDLSPHLIREWGYEPQIIEQYARICRNRLGLSPAKSISAGPLESRGSYAGAASKGKTKPHHDVRAEKAGGRDRTGRRLQEGQQHPSGDQP